MKQKIIFLDFDGVLNSVRTVASDQRGIIATHVLEQILRGDKIESGFDSIAVKLLYRLITLTDSYIVISSTWRRVLNLSNIRKIFKEEFGWNDAEERIIGITRKSDSGKRGDEVKFWIDDYTSHIQNFKYIIIDDGYDFYEHQLKYFIQTDPYEGFLYRDYTKAMNLMDGTLDEEIL